MIKYADLGNTRKLNDIVIAGTHDAGITGGGSGVQTQTMNILQQATCGVRFFDLRIAAAVTSKKHESGRPLAELRAFHADDKVAFKFNRKVVVKGSSSNEALNVRQSKLAGGAFGLSLSTMLEQARDFVESDLGKSEFLILKFDKCTNWALIADACLTILDTSLYEGAGNINNKTLADLRGKVIVLFSPSGLKEVPQLPGILAFKNLAAGSAYEPVFDGLQYYGKGGTSPFNPLNKLKQNIKKQTKLMKGAAALGNPDVIGMMYWTTTGLVESIKKRDTGMWDPPNMTKMKRLWGTGLGDFVDDRIPMPPMNNALANAQQRRAFFPNIIMIDFADHKRCEEIRSLNDLSASHLADLV